MNTLAERAKFARDRLSLSQQEVADATGMSQPSYYKIENGKTKRTTYINELARVFKVNVDWLASGIGEMVADEQPPEPEIPTKSHAGKASGSDYVVIGGQSEYPLVDIKYLDIKASCGPGYINQEYPEAYTQAYTVEFLRANELPIDGEGLVLMHACSDSMGNTIPHGTLMLVNTNESEFDNFINNKVYVFNADGEMMCKRAHKNLDGTVVLKSDSLDKENYPDQLITRTTFSQFQLFGRVRYTFLKH
ncbi:LexA family transcriptional regulator [Psychrobacter arenosus]|uniref:XRE family transcriptional regulator n=1 Tax=Psychrobacter arenosus TaxID=256326 RepID=UPI00191B3A9F|nr:LexA family transcriptional regulator [Psychrobacter arenosus]